MKNQEFNNDFSEEIFESTYAYRNETVDQMWMRVASSLASVETNKKLLDRKIL